jgi:hypothetical protein
LWYGILGDRLIGPYVLPQRLTGRSYLNFVVNTTLPKLLDDVPLGRRQQMWFMHDGVPPHFIIAVREHLHNTYPEQWVGHGRTTAWPPCLPNLNMLDFFPAGTFKKSVVYATAVNDVVDIQQQVAYRCQVIWNTSWMSGCGSHYYNVISTVWK